MAKLFLHIGHNKTGSSFLQSAFSANLDVLKQNNIIYPIRPGLQETAAKGFVTMGNIKEFEAYVEGGKLDLNDSETLLFSSEMIYASFSKSDFQKDFRHFVAKHDFAEIEVLFFVRDPIDYAASNYQERVKGGGMTHSFEGFLSTWDVTSTIKGTLDFFDSLPNTKVSIYNYSVDRKNILAITEEWLGLQKGALVPPSVGTVNRSLTRSELRLQLEINKRFGGKAGHLLSRPLCNKTPEIRGDNIRPTRAQQEQLWDRLSDSLNDLNNRLPKHARYDRVRDISDGPDADESSDANFSTAQLQVIAEIIADHAKEKERPALNLGTLKSKFRRLEEKSPNLRSGRVKITSFIRRRLLKN
ncbi:hypothetical protein [Aliiroseovarius sediminis]|uniref:hypothetical protein n=1 Tax=Aliiroseovarius sediminis TaxID=2925839 RepID=UPI001F578CBC|nr:hypothetical protein [Aliiroseovarius sediminis]MCI2395756.1 hypothetical protein [Aliiroseovarius sediminis]